MRQERDRDKTYARNESDEADLGQGASRKMGDKRFLASFVAQRCIWRHFEDTRQ